MPEIRDLMNVGDVLLWTDGDRPAVRLMVTKIEPEPYKPWSWRVSFVEDPEPPA
jgi:hypothetical protein